jgi:hypothetical protein
VPADSTASSAPTQSVTASVTPQPTATPNSTDAPRATVVEIADQIAPRAFGQSGPLVAFAVGDGRGDLLLADLSAGTVTALASADKGVMDVSVSGDAVAWVDASYDHSDDSVPCGDHGGVRWICQGH